VRGLLRRFPRAEIELPVSFDEAHGPLNGPPTRRILERAYQAYGRENYLRSASTSVASLLD
jgi:hypothetical protein